MDFVNERLYTYLSPYHRKLFGLDFDPWYFNSLDLDKAFDVKYFAVLLLLYECVYVLCVQEFTANLYCISLSIDAQYT